MDKKGHNPNVDRKDGGRQVHDLGGNLKHSHTIHPNCESFKLKARSMAIPRLLWTRIIEVWIFTVLVLFVVIRILGSLTAHQLFSHTIGRLHRS